MSAVLAAAGAEARHLLRSRIALTGLALVTLLTLVSALTSGAYHAEQARLQSRLQAAVDSDFVAQPNRHPHRMVHFGSFALRPSSGLAALDPGVDAFTGNMIFLEGHRQNSANFSDARQSSLLVRFGQLSPALVLQVIAPLLLIFIGAGSVAGERERGTLRQALLSGGSAGRILAGKALTLAGASLVIAVPALALLAWIGAAGAATPSAIGLAAAGYGAYLLFWVLLILAVSSMTRRARTALIALVAVWTFSVILVPRAAPELAASTHPLPTRIETDIAIQRDLHRLGDSHNPDDPFFKAFEQRTLARYGVDSIDKLPLNYSGLVGMEGERLTSSLFDRYGKAAFGAMEAQSRLMDRLAVLSPTIALRRLSMVVAETDLSAYRRFMDQAEAYRYKMVQSLNWLQASAVSAQDDRARNRDAAAEQRTRISADHWRKIPQFKPTRPEAAVVVAAAMPALGLLALWLAAAGAALVLAARRLDRITA